MKIISQGKIFLSDQRSVTENERIKRYSTFNFDNIYNPAKEAIGNLYALHDDMLAPNAAINFFHREQGYVIIIPVLGSISYFDEDEKQIDIEVGKSVMIFHKESSFFKLQNPYPDATISYLIIAIKSDEQHASSPSFLDIDLSKPNQLDIITNQAVPFKIGVGRFKGRGENEYALSPSSTLYAFVLSGVFEIDGRLLHERDGIALWATEKIEMEALSNDAILLTIELPE